MRRRLYNSPVLDRRTLLSSIAAVCAGGASGNAASANPLHVSVATEARRVAGRGAVLRLLAPHGCEANVWPVIKAFEAATGVRVELREVPVDEINAQLTLDSLSGDGDYDLALPATFGIPDLAAGGIIRPITSFARQYEPEGFRDGVLYSTGDSFDGEVYGFQADGDTYVMFYHREWLEDAAKRARYEDRYGTPLAIPSTWDELDRQMAFFHSPEEGRYGGALFRTPGYLAWEWWVRFHAKGVWPLSADLEPQIASDEGVAALEDMIRATEMLYPQARSAGLFDNWAHYGEGNTYCNIGWGGSQKYLNGPQSRMRGRMVYGPTPTGSFGGLEVAMPYFNWGWSYVVASISKQPELAYLFALFASTSEMSTLAIREQDGYFDPFRPEHYADPVIVETYSPEFLAVHEASLRASIPDLYLANQGAYFRALSEWLDEAVNRGADPRKSLERAATQWSVLSLRAGREKQRKRWMALRAKYPAAAQAALRDVL
ncbi:MAG: extracellular solute-binding protein [Pseudomonadota bacterium]